MKHQANEGSIFDTKFIAEQIKQKIQEGTTIDPKEALTEVLAEYQINTALEPEQEEEIMQEFIGEQTQPMMGVPATASRKLLNDLNTKYSKSDLDFLEALKIWKKAKLTPTEIRGQVASDIGMRINMAEAKILHRKGAEITAGYDELYEIDENTEVDDKIKTSRALKLTPAIRASMEKVGHNLYRTKKAELLWKIDMKETGDGERVPYLVRVETIEAQEEEEDNRRV